MRRIRPLLGFVAILAAPCTVLARDSDRDVDAGEPASSSAPPKPFELRDRDRVVFLGNALIERELPFAYVEAALTQAHPLRTISFRNLGWSGDDVTGRARVGFDPPERGFALIEARLRESAPTVVVLAYGSNESFDGRAGLESFLTGFARILALVDALGARAIILSPLRHEDLGRPLPDPAEHNRDLALYVDALRELAEKRGDVFVDLFAPLGAQSATDPRVLLTDNGIHLTAYGYWRFAQHLASSLGARISRWSIDVDLERGSIAADGTRFRGARLGSDGVRFAAVDLALPWSPIPGDAPDGAARVAGRRLRIQGLAPGRWVVEADGRVIASDDAESFARGLDLKDDPAIARVEQLRRTIARKNFLFFCKWRPQNDTYLFLFRKHEQGDLASEVDQFEPLIAVEEARIAELRVPVEVSYVVRRATAEESAR